MMGGGNFLKQFASTAFPDFRKSWIENFGLKYFFSDFAQTLCQKVCSNLT
jgi:hypothetical protein